MRSAGFLIPGGLGVQEGGILVSGIWLGLAPEIVLAAALLKRARELVYGVPGLIAWSYLDGPGRDRSRAELSTSHRRDLNRSKDSRVGRMRPMRVSTDAAGRLRTGQPVAAAQQSHVTRRHKTVDYPFAARPSA